MVRFDATLPGTAFEIWERDGRVSNVPRLDLSSVAGLLVVGAHPDDESLGCGGLIAECVRRGIPVRVVIVTDGGASHESIVETRAAEARAALPDVQLTMLGYPDGETRENVDAIERDLAAHVTENTLIAAPWRGDGHRDHRVVGEIVARISENNHLIEYPVWMWHWANPDDVAWSEVIGLDIDVEAKQTAISQYRSQIGDVLRPDFLEHFARPVEVYFASRALPAGYFDALYARRDDPWRLETRWYEERKRAVTMASLPAHRFGRALEIGSSIGILTQLLGERCDSVLTIDISAAAVEAARSRVGPNVQVRQADATVDFPEGAFDLIVFSEIGYYLSADALNHLLGRVSAALAPAGTLVACHWRHSVADYPLSGDAVHRALATRLPFERIAQHVERDFLLDVYSRDPRSVAEREGLA